VEVIVVRKWSEEGRLFLCTCVLQDCGVNSSADDATLQGCDAVWTRWCLPTSLHVVTTIFRTEDRDGMFLRKVGTYPRRNCHLQNWRYRQYRHFHFRDNLESQTVQFSLLVRGYIEQ
jgi:hypothetical protein